jgi:hypothetical protein
VLCFSSFCIPILPVSLDCPFLIASSVFSNVYLPLSLDGLKKKPVVNSGVHEWLEVSASYKAPAVLLIYTKNPVKSWQ